MKKKLSLLFMLLAFWAMAQPHVSTAPESRFDFVDEVGVRMVEDASSLTIALIKKFDGFGNLQTWVKSLDAMKDATLLAKLDALDASYFKTLDTDLAKSAFSNALAKNAELVGAWKSSISRSNLRTNPSFLETVDGLVKHTNKGVDYAQIETALNGSFGEVIANASGDNLTQMLTRMQMDHFDAQHLEDIIVRLDNPNYGIKEDLIQHPKAFKDFDEIIENPGFFWEKYSEGDFAPGSNLERWAHGKWFKELSANARKFEGGVGFTEFKKLYGLADDQVVKQVTLIVDGARIRIDYLGFNPLTGKYYLGEAKFSTKVKNWETDWYAAATKNQKPVFRAIQNGEVKSITVRASDKEKLKKLKRIELENEYSITFDKIELSIFGSEAGKQAVKSITQLK